MADDLKELRQQFDADVDEWAEARKERAKDIRYLAGDPWEPGDKDAREKAGRPYLAFDELNQYVNQVVNDLRANPRAIAFAPGDDESGASEDGAQLYSDKTREIEYRSNAKMAYTLAAENAIQGGYGYVRVTSKYAPKSVRNQELWIEPVPDPDSIIVDPFHLRPDGSDIQRAFVLEHRRLDEFKQQFPEATTTDFEAYQNQADYSTWVQPDRILLAESWKVLTKQRRLLIVQPPAVQPPPGMMDMRPMAQPQPIELWADEWGDSGLPEGVKVLDERMADDPSVVMQLVNGVEVLEETPWPGKYIPIIPCYGRMLYVPDGARTKRLLMSMIRLARDPYMAYCFYRTCEIENVGMTTKNPYWAYEGQLSPAQLTEIQKSLHEPVAVLFAKAFTQATGSQLLPLPQHNVNTPQIQALSVGAEETRRAIQSAIASNFLPTQAQRQNEKSGKALERMDQSSQKGTFHFVDHYEGMIRQCGVVIEDVFDKIYDAKRRIGTRKADDTTAPVWINDPGNKEAINVKGRYSVTVSSGPDFDSTRDAASDFADNLIGATDLMQMLGPGKAQKLVALAIKLKVRETGIGAIGDQIVEIIDPPPQEQLTPEQMQAKHAEMEAQVQQLTQMLQVAQREIEQGLTKEKAKTERDLTLAEVDAKLQAFLQELKGNQALKLQQLKDGNAILRQDDQQRHEVGLAAEDADSAQRQMDRQDTMAVANMGQGGASNTGASA